MLFFTSSLEVDLKPDWLASPHVRPRGGKSIDMVVIRHSGSASVGKTLEATLSTEGTTGTSVHYVVCADGFVVKMVRDADAACHSRYARWAGHLDVTERSIGIELVHASGPVPAAQNDALVALLQALQSEHGFPDHHVVGLEDVATTRTDPVLVGSAIGDPGPDFDWASLEGHDLGLRLSGPTPNVLTMYHGAFAGTATVLDQHASAAAITELQNDLAAIGYSVAATGVYDKHTRAAVRQFVLHFVNHARTRTMGTREKNGRELGIATAVQIKTCQTW